MIERLKSAVGLLGAAAVAVLAGCSTPLESPGAPAVSGAATVAAKDAVETTETMTGSRVPRKTTDRLLRKTDAKEMERDRPPDPGPLNK